MESRLNCTSCGLFRQFSRKRDDPKSVVRCDECGKRHSTDSLFMIDPDRQYERDEAGTLVDPRIPT